MKYIKTYEGSVFGPSSPGHEEPIPKFKIGDEVIVVYDLKQFGRPYGIVAGDFVTITDFWIYSNGAIMYSIDSPKIREIKKGINTRDDDFPEHQFDYEWNIDAKKYNL
jgi:hypothetical protein